MAAVFFFLSQQLSKTPKASDWNGSKAFLRARRQKCTYGHELKGGKGKRNLWGGEENSENVDIAPREKKKVSSNWRREGTQRANSLLKHSLALYIQRCHSHEGCFPLWGNGRFKCWQLSHKSRKSFHTSLNQGVFKSNTHKKTSRVKYPQTESKLWSINMMKLRHCKLLFLMVAHKEIF